MRLAGRSAVITGAASGIGRATAALFAREGATLALCDVNEHGLKETVTLLPEATGRVALCRRIDLADLDDIAAFAQQAMRSLPCIDIVVNNAGINYVASIESTTAEAWATVHDVNVRSGFFLVQQLLPAISKSQRASIVNVSSSGAIITPVADSCAYTSSKGAIVSLTRALARDLAPRHIRVNCVVPSLVETPMSMRAIESYPEDERAAFVETLVSRSLIKRLADPQEIAATTLFLASDDASYITGASIAVDGGFTAS